MGRRLVFLSSSGDLAKTRENFDIEFRRWNSSLGQTELDLKTYLWEKDEVQKDLDKREPIQGQLPRTDGDEVLLTVGFLGERCGIPLANGTPLDRDFSAWRNQEKFRLLHPWPTDIEESEEALKSGFYPLTGTIFEQLCAIDAALADPDRDKPFIGYVADMMVSPGTDPEHIVFNGGKLLRSTLDGKSKAKRKALESMLMRQQKGLLNYLKALRASGTFEPRYFDSEEAMREKLLERTKEKMLPLALPPEGTDGYRNALTFYDIRDSYKLPGLQKEADGVAEEFWEDAFGPEASFAKRTLLLTGSSGCGKSSYMRRGILGSLVREKKQKAIAIAFRPNDLDPHGGGNCLLMLWKLILDSDLRIKTNFVMDPAHTHASIEAANALTRALEEIDARLLLGVDQFEEFLDILFRQSESAGAANRLRPVFDFLRACLEGGRVAIVATLENQRETLRDNFAQADFGWRLNKTKTLELNEERVRLIVEAPLKAAGLKPDEEAFESIVARWKALDSGKDKDVKASTLPLLGLWLARLQDRNRELARRHGAGLGDEFRETGGVLGIDRINDMPPMENLINELATNAWLEVAETYGAVEERNGKKVPKKANINMFLQPFIGLSQGDQKELRNVTRPKKKILQAVLIERFLRSRLMVPVIAGQQDLVRLTHQAVIDQWKAGAEWFRDFETYLKNERKLLRQAEGWHDDGRPADLQVTEPEIAAAASVLDMLRATAGASLSPKNALLRDYAIEVFRHSKTPLAQAPHSLDGTLHVHVAARYDLGGLLEAWFRAPGADAEAIAKARDLTGSAPIYFASFSSPAAVETLLRHKAQVKDPDKRGFHPICSCIQFGRKDILDLLIGHYRIDEAIHDDGRAMLHHAALVGQLGTLLYLIERGASLDAGDLNGSTPLIYAAASGELDIVAELRSPTRVLAKRNETAGSWRAIDMAAFKGKWKTIDLLLTTPGLTDEDRASLLKPRKEGEFSPLALAAVNLRPGTVRWFLDLPDTDPADASHLLGDSYGNLAELTVEKADRSLPGYDQRLRDTLEVLLGDSRIDPARRGKKGKSLHELVAHSGPAGRLVNAHPRCPRDWDALTPEAARDWIRKAHRDEVFRIAQKRPDLLLDETVLPQVPGAAWPAVAPLLVARVNLRANEGPRLIKALQKNYPFAGDDAPKNDVKAELLRNLIDRIDPTNRARSGGPLLALVVAQGTVQEVGALVEKRVPLDYPSGRLGSRPAHLAAQRSDKATFELLARAMQGKPAPRDGWGRVPSEVAPKPDRAGIAAIEAMYFKAEG